MFCPTYRRKVLAPPIDARPKTLIQDCVEQWEQAFVEVEAMPDHVHLIVGGDPPCGIHRLVTCMKGTTAHQLRQAFPDLKKKIPSWWTNSSSVGTGGDVTIDTVTRSGESQKGT